MLKFQRGFVAVTCVPHGGSHVRVLGLLLARRREAALREGGKVSAEALALALFNFLFSVAPFAHLEGAASLQGHGALHPDRNIIFVFPKYFFFRFRLGRWCFVAMFFDVILQTASFGGGCGESMGAGDEMRSAQDGVTGTRWGFPGAAERGIYPCSAGQGQIPSLRTSQGFVSLWLVCLLLTGVEHRKLATKKKKYVIILS